MDMNYYNDELYHYGIKGMKWGVRRARKNDASGTSSNKRKSDNDDNQTTKKKGLSDKQKKAIKVGVAVAGTALAAYGAYKVSKVMKEKSYIKKAEIGKSFVSTKTESWKDLSLDIFQDGSYKIYSTKGGTLFEGADSGKNYEVAERIYNNIRNSNGYDLSVRR